MSATFMKSNIWSMIITCVYEKSDHNWEPKWKENIIKWSDGNHITNVKEYQNNQSTTSEKQNKTMDLM